MHFADNKEKCVIIDFIGNYRNADRKLKMLSPTFNQAGKMRLQQMETIADTSIVLNFDVSVIELLQEMTRKAKRLNKT